MNDIEWSNYRTELNSWRERNEASIFEDWAREINSISYPFSYKVDHLRNEIILYTEYPGVLIGMGGEHINILKSIFKELYNKNYSVEVKEVTGFFCCR